MERLPIAGGQAGLEVGAGELVLSRRGPGRTAEPQGGGVVGQSLDHLVCGPRQVVGRRFELAGDGGDLRQLLVARGAEEGEDHVEGAVHVVLGDQSPGPQLDGVRAGAVQRQGLGGVLGRGLVVSETPAQRGEGLDQVHVERLPIAGGQAGLEVGAGELVLSRRGPGRTAEPQGGGVVGQSLDHLVCGPRQVVGRRFELAGDGGDLRQLLVARGAEEGEDHVEGAVHVVLGDQSPGPQLDGVRAGAVQRQGLGGVLGRGLVVSETPAQRGEGLDQVHVERLPIAGGQAGLEVGAGELVLSRRGPGRTAEPQGGGVVGQSLDHLVCGPRQVVGRRLELAGDGGDLRQLIVARSLEEGEDHVEGAVHVVQGDQGPHLELGGVVPLAPQRQGPGGVIRGARVVPAAEHHSGDGLVDFSLERRALAVGEARLEVCQGLIVAVEASQRGAAQPQGLGVARQAREHGLRGPHQVRRRRLQLGDEGGGLRQGGGGGAGRGGVDGLLGIVEATAGNEAAREQLGSVRPGVVRLEDPGRELGGLLVLAVLGQGGRERLPEVQLEGLTGAQRPAGVEVGPRLGGAVQLPERRGAEPQGGSVVRPPLQDHAGRGDDLLGVVLQRGHQRSGVLRGLRRRGADGGRDDLQRLPGVALRGEGPGPELRAVQARCVRRLGPRGVLGGALVISDALEDAGDGLVEIGLEGLPLAQGQTGLQALQRLLVPAQSRQGGALQPQGGRVVGRAALHVLRGLDESLRVVLELGEHAGDRRHCGVLGLVDGLAQGRHGVVAAPER